MITFGTLKASEITPGSGNILVLKETVSVPLDLKNQAGYDTTTATGANVVLQSDGTFRRSTSSKKYKQNIVPYEKGLADVLKLEAKSFTSITDDTDRIYSGFIAEDVEELGLIEFVEYNNDNNPESIFYSHMMTLAVNAIKELSAKNDELEARILTLETV